jgi:hypothetical protein
MAMGFLDLMDNLTDTMTELDEEQVAEIYNQICSRKVKPKEDSFWSWEYEDGKD